MNNATQNNNQTLLERYNTIKKWMQDFHAFYNKIDRMSDTFQGKNYTQNWAQYKEYHNELVELKAEMDKESYNALLYQHEQDSLHEAFQWGGH